MAHLLFALFLLTIPVAAGATRKLNTTAAIVAAALAVIIYSGTGYTGIALLGTFFLLGVIATSWKNGFKQASGFAPIEKTGRDAGLVMANAGMAALLSLLALCGFDVSLMTVLVACSFSSAAADTVSSELGVIYGKRTFGILSLKPGKRGDNGVISAEGTVLGVAASLVVSLVYAVSGGFQPYAIFCIVVAGTVGNIVDSVLGATLERRQVIGNNSVNFLNTLAAAVAGLLLLLLA
jgi:uncharacterized protein (TIGR00297 family)